MDDALLELYEMGKITYDIAICNSHDPAAHDWNVDISLCSNDFDSMLRVCDACGGEDKKKHEKNENSGNSKAVLRIFIIGKGKGRGNGSKK